MTWRSRGLNVATRLGDLPGDRLVPLLRFGAGQGGLDHADHEVVVERLFQEIDGAKLHGLHRKRHVAVAGHDDDGQTPRHRPQPPQQFDAVDAGHAYIGDDAAEGEASEPVEEGLRGIEQGDVEAGSAEQELQRIPHRIVVVDDVNHSPRHRSCFRSVRRAA